MSSNKLGTAVFGWLLLLAGHRLPTEAATPVKQCAAADPLPLMVQLEDCSELPCALGKDEANNVAIQFVATRDAMRGLRAEVHLTTLGVRLPVELPEERGDVCGNLMFGAYCPLDAGEDVTYHLVLALGSSQPEVPAKLEVALRDPADQEVVACFTLDVRVKKNRRRAV